MSTSMLSAVLVTAGYVFDCLRVVMLSDGERRNLEDETVLLYE